MSNIEQGMMKAEGNGGLFLQPTFFIPCSIFTIGFLCHWRRPLPISPRKGDDPRTGVQSSSLRTIAESHFVSYLIQQRQLAAVGLAQVVPGKSLLGWTCGYQPHVE